MFMFSDHLLPFLRSNPSLCNFCLTSVIFQSLSKSTLHHWEENSAESETNGSLWWCKVRTVKTSQPSSLSLSVFDAKEIRFIKFFSVKSFFVSKLLETVKNCFCDQCSVPCRCHDCQCADFAQFFPRSHRLFQWLVDQSDQSIFDMKISRLKAFEPMLHHVHKRHRFFPAVFFPFLQ